MNRRNVKSSFGALKAKIVLWSFPEIKKLEDKWKKLKTKRKGGKIHNTLVTTVTCDIHVKDMHAHGSDRDQAPRSGRKA